MTVSFDVCHRALEPHANRGDESDHQLPVDASAVETDLSRSLALETGSPKTSHKSQAKRIGNVQPATIPHSGGLPPSASAAESKEDQVACLQRTVTDLKTANKAKEIVLRTTKEELKNARETLNETFAEYAKIRDEIKTVKQKMNREHQAVVYRKDIELFALRKGNEQKENYIKEHDAKLDEVFKQQKATLELKDAQLKMLKERLTFMERQNSPTFKQESDNSDGDQALEVRLLRVKKGRAPSDYEKDAKIAKLEEQLAIAKKAAEEVVSQQGELQRAWDIAKKIQASLREERDLHSQTKAQLQELTVRYEEVSQNSPLNAVSRLPTIEEDKHELEAMFDTAQEDNLRLYGEVEVLEKRLREANSRMFLAEQEAQTVREQLNVEKAISSDLEHVSPSIVHRVHFQRLESELREMQNLFQTKDKVIDGLQSTISEKDQDIKGLRAEVDAAVSFHTQDQDEIESLKQSIVELEKTKEQLMRDHERLASQRARQRSSLVDRESARSSGATLIQELSPQLTHSPDDPLPVEPLPPMPETAESERSDSIQQTPRRHLRSESTPNRLSLISTDSPPPELRHSRRKSLGLKDFMKRIVKKSDVPEIPDPPPVPKVQEKERPKSRAALSVKDKNALLRPKTATLAGADKTSSLRPRTAAPASSPSMTDLAMHPVPMLPTPSNGPLRPSPQRRNTPRYYATDATTAETRPGTATDDIKLNNKDENGKPFSRLSWGATNKLKRRSLY